MSEIAVNLNPPPAKGDPESRTIRGIAAPPNATTQRWGRTLRIPAGSVTLADRVPVLRDHDEKRAVGKLVSGEWTPAGLEVVLKLSKTPDADDVLQLAADGVLSLSLGLGFDQDALRIDGDHVDLTASTAVEISTTPFPALSGAEIHTVTFADTVTTEHTTEEGPAMGDNDSGQIDAVALNNTLSNINETLLALSNRPAAQPLPVVGVQRELPLYGFNGQRGQHDFADDFRLTLSDRDRDAAERISRFMVERFAAVTQGDAQALTPNGFLPALYVGAPPYSRTLTQFLTSGTITSANAFSFPFLKNPGGPFIAPHVPGVEPTVADSPVWDLDVVRPSALSGKISLLQEVVDLSGAQVIQLIWDMVVMEAEKELEARVATMLDSLTLPADQVIDLSGSTGTALADDFDDLMLDLKSKDRFSGLLASPALFKAFFKARDGDGRRLFPAIGATNADGTAAVGRGSLDLNGLTAVQSKDTQHSYIVDRRSVHQWSSVIQRFDLKTRVASLEVGAFMYEASCVNDLSGVIRVTY